MREKSVETLTPRQLQCLRLVSAGLVAKEIARELRISPDTVAVHIKAGMAKLQVSSRREAGRIVAASEAANPKEISPEEVIAGAINNAETDAPAYDATMPDRLQENRTLFGFHGQSEFRLPERVEDASDASWSRVLMTVALAIGIGVIILMAFPLSESFQRLANLVDPPTR